MAKEADDTGGNDGGSSNSGSQGSQGSTGLAPDIERGLRNLIARAGGEDAAAQQLYQDNHQQREQVRQLKAKLQEVQPDAKLLERYKELGSPDDLATARAELDKATKRLEAVERERTTTQAAQLVGFKPTVLADLAEAKGLEVEVRTVDQKGEDGATAQVQVPYAKRAGTEDAAVPLVDYVEKHLADYQPSLATQGSSTGSAQGGAAGNGGAQGARQPPVLHRQGSGATTGKGTSSSLLEQRLEANRKQAAQRNPLRSGAADD